MKLIIMLINMKNSVLDRGENWLFSHVYQITSFGAFRIIKKVKF